VGIIGLQGSMAGSKRAPRPPPRGVGARAAAKQKRAWLRRAVAGFAWAWSLEKPDGESRRTRGWRQAV